MLHHLNAAIEQAKKTALYKKKLQGITRVESFEEFSRLPFTTKQDLRGSYPYGALGVSMDQVIEVHTSSGTTGKPTLSLFTQNDLDISARCISKTWHNFGITKFSKVQFLMGYGLFSGAALNTYALQELGAFVVPAGIQATKKQVELMHDFKIDTIVATPSYYLRLHNYLQTHGIPLSSLNLRTGIAAGEVYSDALKEKISRLLNIRIFDHYGLCEVNTGIIYECKSCARMAVIKDYVYAEVVDPASGEPLPVGEYGELVLTATMKEASPIIRYRTGDAIALVEKSSSCQNCAGSTIVSRIRGRLDDTIFYRGLLLSPHDIRDFIILESDEMLVSHVKIEAVTDDDDMVVGLRVKLALAQPEVSASYLRSLQQKLCDQTKVNIPIELVPDAYFGDQLTTKVKLVEYVAS